ncbi:MAG: hypothetical protein K0S41_843 [Anaerocolumna sp.]|nr:hypothetical protein [Anaerocolumna sp.]
MRSINKYMIITNKCNHISLVITKASQKQDITKQDITKQDITKASQNKISQSITKQDITKTRYHQSKISLNQGITKSRYSQNQNN